MKKTRLISILPAVLALAACSTAYKSITARMPDLTPVAGGVYRGYYDLSATPIEVTLDVTVQNQKITDIKIVKHQCSPVGKKAEKIVDRIIETQRLDIDAVSGATASSKAILKAVENALEAK
jgi:uncharacterized protein with FMN-binding domain